MNLLILSPNLKIPKNKAEIDNFESVWCYYLYHKLKNFDINVNFLTIPNIKNEKELCDYFDNLKIDSYHGILVLGLRYFSHVPEKIGLNLKKRFSGILCQLYDGSRLDTDPVDVTFTFRNDDWRYPLGAPNNRHLRHHNNNVYIGWSADSNLIQSRQPKEKLNVLVDHSAFNHNSLDRSFDTLMNIRNLIHSGIYEDYGFKSVSVRRFTSGAVETVDIDNFSIQRYDNTASMSYINACREYSKAHIFCVTHKESVGQSIIESATSGALVISPKNFVNKDRLDTVRHVEWSDRIDWPSVLPAIDIKKSREKASKNSWFDICQTIINTIETRYNEKQLVV